MTIHVYTSIKIHYWVKWTRASWTGSVCTRTTMPQYVQFTASDPDGHWFSPSMRPSTLSFSFFFLFCFSSSFLFRFFPFSYFSPFPFFFFPPLFILKFFLFCFFVYKCFEFLSPPLFYLFKVTDLNLFRVLFKRKTNLLFPLVL